jgi:hypothetical protein
LTYEQDFLLWRIDPLLGKNLETNNGERCDKYASTTIELLLEMVLCNLLVGSCNSWTTTVETVVFSLWSMLRSYLEDI